MSRIFSAIKDDALRMAIERATAEAQSQVASKSFHNPTKEDLRLMLEETSKLIENHTEQLPDSKRHINERNQKNNNKSSFLNR